MPVQVIRTCPSVSVLVSDREGLAHLQPLLGMLSRGLSGIVAINSGHPNHRYAAPPDLGADATRC